MLPLDLKPPHSIPQRKNPGLFITPVCPAPATSVLTSIHSAPPSSGRGSAHFVACSWKGRGHWGGGGGGRGFLSGAQGRVRVPSGHSSLCPPLPWPQRPLLAASSKISWSYRATSFISRCRILCLSLSPIPYRLDSWSHGVGLRIEYYDFSTLHSSSSNSFDFLYAF